MSLKTRQYRYVVSVLPINIANSKIHVDYREDYIDIYYMYIYIDIYRVSDNRGTVNTTTSPQISDQLGTEKRVKHCFANDR